MQRPAEHSGKVHDGDGIDADTPSAGDATHRPIEVTLRGAVRAELREPSATPEWIVPLLMYTLGEPAQRAGEVDGLRVSAGEIRQRIEVARCGARLPDAEGIGGEARAREVVLRDDIGATELLRVARPSCGDQRDGECHGEATHASL